MKVPLSRRGLLRAGLTASAVGSVAALGGCAATVGPAETRPVVPPKDPDEHITLTYWSWWPALQAVADLWNADHPDIQVRAVTIPGGLDGGYAKMFNSLVAGNQPDLAQVEFFQIPSFLLENGLEDLSRYGALEHADRYDEWQWLQASYIGGHYGIPVDSGPMMYFYRDDKYREWGLDGPPATWDEYAEAARRVAAAEDGAAIETFPVGDADWLAGMCMQAGAQWFGTEDGQWSVNFLDDASVRVAEFWEGLVHEGVLNLTHPVWSTGWFQGLQQGRIGTWTVGSWGDAIIRGNDPDEPGRWKVAGLPQWDPGTRREGTWGGSASVVLTGAPHPHEAVRFAHWLSTDQRAVDAMITECGIGWAASTELNERSVRNQGPDPYFSDQNYTGIVAEATEYISGDWVWGPTLSATKDHIGDAFGAAVADGTSFVDALATAQENTVRDIRAKGLSVRSAS
ncbi:ABC transporter substrate-binding protein [Nocardiopsis aegyptia]|uniref:Multiple sugar transport system substrate-binding protein n=1 Tax=Nocardiopsis aegyptia TaxID=220378 RepID=A0A7Z0EJN4_9ACTN|nr:extracellular solute-binding protein [Nocardiopsis aegyptia]NYJ32473.1 multiple sugar transport system substrate-binding protein [Nocardiopsis aegyptia]